MSPEWGQRSDITQNYFFTDIKPIFNHNIIKVSGQTLLATLMTRKEEGRQQRRLDFRPGIQTLKTYAGICHWALMPTVFGLTREGNTRGTRHHLHICEFEPFSIFTHSPHSFIRFPICMEYIYSSELFFCKLLNLLCNVSLLSFYTLHFYCALVAHFVSAPWLIQFISRWSNNCFIATLDNIHMCESTHLRIYVFFVFFLTFVYTQ